MALAKKDIVKTREAIQWIRKFKKGIEKYGSCLGLNDDEIETLKTTAERLKKILKDKDMDLQAGSEMKELTSVIKQSLHKIKTAIALTEKIRKELGLDNNPLPGNT